MVSGVVNKDQQCVRKIHIKLNLNEYSSIWRGKTFNFSNEDLRNIILSIYPKFISYQSYKKSTNFYISKWRNYKQLLICINRTSQIIILLAILVVMSTLMCCHISSSTTIGQEKQNKVHRFSPHEAESAFNWPTLLNLLIVYASLLETRG